MVMPRAYVRCSSRLSRSPRLDWEIEASDYGTPCDYNAGQEDD